MLEQCCNHSKQCRNNVATLCCAKNRRCESSRVTSPLNVTKFKNKFCILSIYRMRELNKNQLLYVTLKKNYIFFRFSQNEPSEILRKVKRGQKRPIRSNWKSRKQMKSKNEKKKERGRRKEENIRKKWFNTLLVFISCWLRYKWYSFLAEKKCFTEVVYLLIITSRLIWRNDQRKKIESCK